MVLWISERNLTAMSSMRIQCNLSWNWSKTFAYTIYIIHNQLKLRIMTVQLNQSKQRNYQKWFTCSINCYSKVLVGEKATNICRYWYDIFRFIRFFPWFIMPLDHLLFSHVYITARIQFYWRKCFVNSGVAFFVHDLLLTYLLKY